MKPSQPSTVREKAMNSFHVTKEQARQLAEALFPPTNFLLRLRNRMHERGFPHDDPLYVLVCDAYEAVNHLRLHVNNLVVQRHVAAVRAVRGRPAGS
jgi:hypothetical protein